MDKYLIEQIDFVGKRADDLEKFRNFIEKPKLSTKIIDRDEKGKITKAISSDLTKLDFKTRRRIYNLRHYYKHKDKISSEKKEWYWKNREKILKIGREFRLEKKLKKILKIGNKCFKCGFVNPLALEIHHLPNKKAIILCANCHTSLHNSEMIKFDKEKFLKRWNEANEQN